MAVAETCRNFCAYFRRVKRKKETNNWVRKNVSSRNFTLLNDTHGVRSIRLGVDGCENFLRRQFFVFHNVTEGERDVEGETKKNILL